jgi:Tat protein translocase TatC
VESFSAPLGDHIEELRVRVIRCVIVVVVALIVTWCVRGAIMQVLMRPHVYAMRAFQLDEALGWRTYIEPIAAQVKACLVVSLIVTAPWLLYEMWAFVAPGLFWHERRFITRLVFASLLCFAAGVAFGYFLFIPLALRFLVAMSGAGTKPVLMIGPYMSLLFMLTFALGAAFQTPVIMYYLVRWHVISVETVQAHRKLVILVVFVVAAVLTPPDPFTQSMMAVPLIMLYDLGVLIAAPGRRTLLNFAGFTGTIALILVAVVAFYFLWPVGRITATNGVVKVGEDILQTGARASLRRGRICALEPGASARVEFGRKASAPSLLIGGGTRIQVHGSRAVSIYTGKVFADKAAGGSPVQISSLAARATLAAGKAEFAVPEPYTLVVSVAEGEVVVRADERTTRIPAGRTGTFQPGGEPLKVNEIEERWQRIMRGEPGGEE